MSAGFRDHDPGAQWTGDAGRPARRRLSRRAVPSLIGLSGDAVEVNFRQLPDGEKAAVQKIKGSFLGSGFASPADTSGHAYLDIQRRQRTVFYATRAVDGGPGVMTVSLIFLPHEPSVRCWQLSIHDPRKRDPRVSKNGTLAEIQQFSERLVEPFAVESSVKNQLGFLDIL